MVFCNMNQEDQCKLIGVVTILILIDGFLQWPIAIYDYEDEFEVTILILIDGFLQFHNGCDVRAGYTCHNPYFNRWFSAIR